MNKVTPLSPQHLTVTVSAQPASQRAKVSPAIPIIPANQGKPSPDRLRDLFQQELLDFGPALVMCDMRGQITWANAAFRRIADTRVDGGNVGERLRLGEVADEMDFRRTTLFRDWDFAAAGAMQRLRARFAPIEEAGGIVTGFGGMLNLQRDGGQIDASEGRVCGRFTINQADRRVVFDEILDAVEVPEIGHHRFDAERRENGVEKLGRAAVKIALRQHFIA